MPRHKKTVTLPPRHANHGESSSSASSEVSVGRSTFKRFSGWKTIIGFGCLLVAIYVGTLGYLETRVNTPFDDPKVVKDSGLAVPERYWGSYRPGVYFGLKSREPKSPVFGLMWYELAVATHKGIRHWCDQNDKLPSYGWIRHDGVSFGEQVIKDPPYEIVTTFVKTPGGNYGGHWTARVNVTSKSKNSGPFVLIWYSTFEDSGKNNPDSRMWLERSDVRGYTPQLDYFKLSLVTHTGKILHKSQSEAYSPGLHLLKEKFYSLLKLEKNPNFGNIAVLSRDEEIDERDKDINFIPTQLIVEPPFVLDIVYTTEDIPTMPVTGDEYTRLLEERKTEFDGEFEKKFKLKEKGYSETDVSIARASLASMVGGIGYFYGASRVQSQYTSEPVPYWRAPLYTAVPSRSFFPRGFLWDEGFHGMLIGRWNPEIQMDIAAHWLDLINVEGWIPREQILGTEALARVPKEFVVQSNAAANPPMLLIQLAHFIKTRPELYLPGTALRNTLDRMYTRLQAWYGWFQTSQKGEEPTSYRWRGRDDDGKQLNPKTLTSGLDDYPRASHPTDIERHVDLRCWMFAAADAMATIANLLQRDSGKYEVTRDQLGDEGLLNDLHWSSETQTYADYGLHTDKVRLVKEKPKSPQEAPRVVRSVTGTPKPQLVTSAFGYVSLFPMLLKVLKPDSANLKKMLDDLDDPEKLWSPYGLRSLSKSAPLFMKRNTEHDPPYWRGQIWVNVNYLALSALRHYSYAPGPYMDRARELYAALKKNLVSNIITQYKRSGYLFEQYSSTDGVGSGCKPFSGWTALLPLIMADLY